MEIMVKCQKCGSELAIDELWGGQFVNCPSCGQAFLFNAASNAKINSANDSVGNFLKANSQPNKVKQYKVLTQKDKWFSGKFDPEKLEEAINAYAKQGWRVVGCATASFPGFIGGNREELVIILERD